MITLRMKEATDEILKKSIVDIQYETAIVWASRAAAAYIRYGQSRETKWLILGNEFEHEAIEHAACVPDVRFLVELKKVIADHKAMI